MSNGVSPVFGVNYEVVEGTNGINRLVVKNPVMNDMIIDSKKKTEWK